MKGGAEDNDEGHDLRSGGAPDGPQRALTDLRAVYRSLLRGDEVPPPAQLGGLADLLAVDGSWRPDGLVRTREFLEKLLTWWQTTDPAAGPKDSGLTKDDQARAAAVWWGVNCLPPPSHAAVVKKAGLVRKTGRLLSQHSVGNWEKSIIAAVAASPLARDRFESTSAALPRTAFPHWPDQENGVLWPVGTGLEIRLKLAAANAVRSHVLKWDFDPLELLRAVTAQVTADWFGNGIEEDSYHYWLQLNLSVLQPWQDTQRMPARQAAVVLGDQARQQGSKFRLAVARCVQMLMISAAADIAALRTAYKDYLDLRNGVAKSARPAPDAALVRGPAAMAAPLRIPGRIKSAAALKGLADAARAADHQQVKRRLIREYLEARPDVLARARWDEDRRLVALADQSIGFDAVIAEERALVAGMAEAQEHLPAGARWGYRLHRARDRAVTYNKRNQWALGDLEIERASADLARLTDTGMLPDLREQLETGHQLWLSGAGLAVRRLEHMLDVPPGRWESPAAEHAARNALHYSARALDDFTRLRSGFQLPDARHADGYIATPAWEFQTRVIHLRTLIAVRTAVLLGVINEAPVTHGPSAGRSHTPPAGWPALISVESLRAHYLDVIRVPHMHQRGPLEFVRAALGLAFLDAGMLPTELDPERPHAYGILRQTPFLTDAPSNIPAGGGAIKVDMVQAAEWLAAERTDAGPVSWYSKSTGVFLLLQNTSADAYLRFRQAAAASRPRLQSHD